MERFEEFVKGIVWKDATALLRLEEGYLHDASRHTYVF